MTVEGWPNLKEKAKLWGKINIPPTDKYYGFRNLYAKVSNMDNPFGQRHSKCRIDFSSKRGNYLNKYGELVSSDVDYEVDICRIDNSETNNIIKPLTRSSSEHVLSF